MVRCSQLLNRIIIDLTTAEEMGQVGELLVSPQEHRVRGVASTAGFLGRGSRKFTWSQVSSIGKDSLVIRANAPVGDPEEILLDTIPVANLELWTDAGDRVGQVVDFLMDGETGVISEYVFRPDAPLKPDGEEKIPALYSLSRAGVISMSRRRMMVRAAAVTDATAVEADTPPAPPRPRGGLPKPHLPDPSPQWEEAINQGREASEQIQERAQQVAAEAKTRFGKLFGDVKKRTRRLQGQLRETVSDLTADLPTGRPEERVDIKTIDVESMEIWPEDDPQENDPSA